MYWKEANHHHNYGDDKKMKPSLKTAIAYCSEN
uniref:Uncharacterized protein n=1 Tax=Anguilla anguilla TaxID=7936 RepID=A0A0E9TRW5_ANGAN